MFWSSLLICLWALAAPAVTRESCPDGSSLTWTSETGNDITYSSTVFHNYGVNLEQCKRECAQKPHCSAIQFSQDTYDGKTKCVGTTFFYRTKKPIDRTYDRNRYTYLQNDCYQTCPGEEYSKAAWTKSVYKAIQGKSAIKTIPTSSMKTCKVECMKEPKCKSFDQSASSCKLYDVIGADSGVSLVYTIGTTHWEHDCGKGACPAGKVWKKFKRYRIYETHPGTSRWYEFVTRRVNDVKDCQDECLKNPSKCKSFELDMSSMICYNHAVDKKSAGPREWDYEYQFVHYECSDPPEEEFCPDGSKATWTARKGYRMASEKKRVYGRGSTFTEQRCKLECMKSKKLYNFVCKSFTYVHYPNNGAKQCRLNLQDDSGTNKLELYDQDPTEKPTYYQHNCKDVCSPNPCQNGGSCDGSTGSAVCSCKPGYSGTTCQTDIDECAANPCKNGACTQNMPGPGYKCTCDAGWTGTNCDKDVCSPNPCQNGGSCDGSTGSAVCTCKPGYSGTTCQTDIDECAANPCKNGACTQNMPGPGYKCTCDDGWTGTHCDKAVPRTSEGVDCMIPFTWANKQYWDCTSDDWEASWCYIKPGKWDYCPFETGKPKPKTLSGEECKIPFTYEHVVYKQCTKRNANKPWCYKSDGKWEYCDVDPNTVPEIPPAKITCSATKPCEVGFICENNICKIKTVDGDYCKNEFRYEGKLYTNECTKKDATKPWCYKREGGDWAWAYCEL